MSTGTHPPSRRSAGTPGAARGGPGSTAGNSHPARPGVPRAAPPPASAGTAGAPSRVSVLAPRTRVDVALPPDVPVADLLPMLLDLVGEAGADPHEPDPGSPGAGPEGPTGWTLALLGQAPAASERTLASLGVLDGDQLVLRRRAEAAPPPLFDDVVDAVAEATPASFRAWNADWARRVALVALGAGPALAALSLLVAGRAPGTAGGIATAAVAGTLAAVWVVLGAVCARSLEQPAAGAVASMGGVLLAAVCGAAAVPGGGDTAQGRDASLLTAAVGAPNLLLAAVLAAGAAGVALLVLGSSSRSGLAALVAVLTASTLVALAGAVATAADVHGSGAAAGVAAGAGAAALIALSLLPRTGMALARLPLPQVPGSAEELADDPDVVEQAVLDRRADRAHAVMNGLVTGCGAVVAGAAAVLAAAPPPGVRGAVAWALAALLVVLIALRARTYANGLQAVSLLACACGGGLAVGVGWVAAARATTPVVLVAIPVLALVTGGLVLVLGVVVPGRRFSPVVRRAVDVAEAVGIAAVLPVALAVMDLYTAVRLR